MKNKTIAKKFTILALVISTTFSSIGAHRAAAYVDAANLVPNWISGANAPATTVTTGSTVVTTGAGTAVGGAGVVATAGNAAINAVHTTWSTLGKNTLDTLAYGVAQRILSALTANIISWIRGGFHGSPSFAVDTQEIIDDIVESVAGDIIREVKNLSVCEFSVDFVNDLSDSVALEASRNKKKIKPFTPKCPFDGNFTFGASQFYDDFSRGGWVAFGAALEAGGSPYSVQVATAEETEKRKNAGTTASDKKLSWSNGFTDILDTSNCKYPDDILIKMAIKPDKSNLSELELGPDSEPATQSEIKEWQKRYCKTTTPGKIVGDQLTKTLGLDMDRLGFADNMNKIVSAFLDVMTQKALRAVFSTAKQVPPGTALTPILTASERATLENKLAGDSTVIAATTKYDLSNTAFNKAVTKYDEAKSRYDTMWENYKEIKEPTTAEQSALDSANIRLKTASIELDIATADYKTATKNLRDVTNTAKTKYTKEILDARGH